MLTTDSLDRRVGAQVEAGQHFREFICFLFLHLLHKLLSCLRYEVLDPVPEAGSADAARTAN